MLSKHHISQTWKRLEKVKWKVKDPVGNHQLAITFVKDTLLNRTYGGFPAALYAVTIEDLRERIRGKALTHPMDLNHDDWSFLGDSLRSLGINEKAELTCEFLQLAHDTDVTGEEEQAAHLLAIASAVFPERTSFASGTMLREHFNALTNLVYAYLDGELTEDDDMTFGTFARLGERLMELIHTPA